MVIKGFGRYFIAQQFYPDPSKGKGTLHINYTPDLVHVDDGDGKKRHVKSLKHQADLGAYKIIDISGEKEVKNGDIVIVHKYVSANRFIVDGKEYVRILKKHIWGKVEGDPDALELYNTSGMPHEDEMIKQDDDFRMEMQDRKRIDGLMAEHGRINYRYNYKGE